MTSRWIRNLTSVSIVSIGLTLAPSAGKALAATVYVDASNGSGLEDGTASQPYNTIREGIEAAVAGDTVSVAPGIYYGAIELKDQVRVVSQRGPRETVIDGAGAPTVVMPPYSVSSNGYIEGFTIRNGTSMAVNAANRVSFWGPSSMQVHNCVLRDIQSLGIGISTGASVTVTRTAIFDIGTATNPGFAISSIWCPKGLLLNVTIHNTGIAIAPYGTGFALFNTTISKVKYVVYLPGTYGWGYVEGANNNIWNYEQLSRPNDMGRYPSYYWTGTISADPAFVDPLTGDFRLGFGSPLIDAGVDVGLPYNGAAPDIGAYESPVDIATLVEGLAESYQDVPLESFKNAGEQRRHALNNKIMALLSKVTQVDETLSNAEKVAIYRECLDKLTNDIWAKADGSYGGNPANDWITTREEQDRLYARVTELSNEINAEINRLLAP